MYPGPCTKTKTFSNEETNKLERKGGRHRKKTKKLRDLADRKKKRCDSLNKKAAAASTSTKKTRDFAHESRTQILEDLQGPKMSINLYKEMKAAGGQDSNATSTAKTPLQNE